MKSSGNSHNKSKAWMRIAEPPTGPSNEVRSVDIRLMLLAAHPDDETIGASLIMARVADAIVVFLTDGAPRDTNLWSASVSGPREHYAQTRWKEAVAALALVGISPERIVSLGAIDQEAIQEVTALAELFAAMLRRYRPDIVITDPYEGGHPDHDTAALVASLALRLLKRSGEPAPEFLEMASYHLRDGKCLTGQFLSADAGEQPTTPELILQLSPEERTRKEKMMACYGSQSLVLQDFPTQSERLRPRPEYDFTKPPHPGKLWYESLGWPMTGDQWRKLAAESLAHFDEYVCG